MCGCGCLCVCVCVCVCVWQYVSRIKLISLATYVQMIIMDEQWHTYNSFCMQAGIIMHKCIYYKHLCIIMPACMQKLLNATAHPLLTYHIYYMVCCQYISAT